MPLKKDVGDDQARIDSETSSRHHTDKSSLSSQMMLFETEDRHDDNVADADVDVPFLLDDSSADGGIWKAIRNDFDPARGGDRKILRAIGRTATVNAVVVATAALGPVAAVAGYATGGCITAKRLVADGIARDDPREVAKSLAVFGSATSASLAGQAITGAVAVRVLGASLPIAGAMAFGVGCVCGISAGALSEWGVDRFMKKKKTKKKEDPDDSYSEDPCVDDNATKSPATSPNASNNDRGGNEPTENGDKTPFLEMIV